MLLVLLPSAVNSEPLQSIPVKSSFSFRFPAPTTCAVISVSGDVTCLLRDRLSYLNLFVILKFFSMFSGLSVNDDKTELFVIEPQKLQQQEFYHKTCSSIKILGIYFDYHKITRRNLNFNSILKSIKKNSEYVEMARSHTSWWNSNC